MLPGDLVHAAMMVQIAAKPGLFYDRQWKRKPRKATRESVEVADAYVPNRTPIAAMAA
jgi:hypothetical protein